MTIDTSNPDKLTWGEMPREVKAEMAYQKFVEGKQMQYLFDDVWRDHNLAISGEDGGIVRIKPEEKRETVHGYATRLGLDLPSACITWETVNGKIDKSVKPNWVE